MRLQRLSTITKLFALFTSFGLLVLLAVIYMSWQEVRQKAVSELGYVNAFVYKTFENDLFKYESLLSLLGERLQERDVVHHPERSRKLLEHTLAMNPNLAGFGLARTDGSLFLVTGIPQGKQLPNLLQTEPSRSSFQQTLTHGHITLGRTYYMKLLGKWVVPLRLPIYGADGKVSYVMTTGINLLSTRNIWQPKNLPDDISTLLINKDLYPIFVSPLSEKSMARWYSNPVPEKTLSQVDIAALRSPGMKVFDIDDRDGHRQLVMSEYHPGRQITSVTTIPYAVLLSALFGRLKYLLLGIAIFYSFSLLLYLMMNRQDRARSRELIWNASHDALTGLPNRFFLQEKAQKWTDEHREFSTLFMDLDNFKGVNDNYGHPFGDRLLQVIAERLLSLVDAHEYVIRHGGDEFIILTTRTDDRMEAFVRRIREAVGKSVRLDEIVLHTSVSMGIAHSPKDGTDMDDLLSKADIALYEAKQRKSGHFVYSVLLEEKSKRRYVLEMQMRKAVLSEEFYVLFQPQFDTQTLALTGVEALARWKNPVLGDVSPQAFITVAEETALIRDIGAFILERSCIAVLEIWETTGTQFRLSVNVSAEELLCGDYVEQLLGILNKAAFPATMLTIEVTESVFIREVSRAKAVLNTLRQHGVGIALDDFGTGYSSLSMLSGLPLTELKIDKSFVKGMEKDVQYHAIVEAIATLGRTLDLEIVAEGAEDSHYEQLRSIGCSKLQGFAFGVPMNGGELSAFVLSSIRAS